MLFVACTATLLERRGTYIAGRLVAKTFSNYVADTGFTQPRNSHAGSANPANRNTIAAAEFQTRRSTIMKLIREASPAGVGQLLVCIPSSTISYMANHVPYPFRQSSNFRYLCGLTEPDSLLLLHSESSSEYRSHLFVPKHTTDDEKWHGPSVLNTDVAMDAGVDFVYPVSELERYLQDILKTVDRQSLGLWCDPSRRWLSQNTEDVRHTVFPVWDDFILQKPARCTVLGMPSKFVDKARVLKSSAEAELIRRAVTASTVAFKSAMVNTEPGMTERQLWALMEFQSVFNGADRLAFPPVCASGNRAATIHYIKNSEVMQAGEMVLVDSGCEVEGYCSDMSRTWPVNSTFTSAQAALYNIVLEVQSAILARIMSGGTDYSKYPTLDELYFQMLKLLDQQLQRHRVIPQSKDDQQRKEFISKHFCCHHLGHHLGMDVHDCMSVSRSRRMEEGMMFTVEPGLYIEAGNQLVSEEYRGNGIRIEDIVWLGPGGPEILTKDCPSQLDEIQKLRASTGRTVFTK